MAARNALDTLKSQQNEVWFYRFDWDEEPAPFNDIYGAAHAFDLLFLFGNFGPSLSSSVVNSMANAPGRIALSKAMMASLGAFAQLSSSVVNSMANAPGRIALSKAMMASLGAFARTGDPNAPAALGVTWPLWPATLLFDATLTDKAISIVP